VSQALANQERVVPSFNEARADFERRYLIKVLRITEGNVTHAARIAQRNRTDFYKLLNRHSLEASDFKPGDANKTDSKDSGRSAVRRLG
jgi:two-component system response regulator GlrR